MCCWQWILHVGSGWNWCICPSLKVPDQESPWFSAASAAAIVHRNHVFHFYQKDKSSESKVRFKQASKFCKRVLQAAKLAYANKAKESITSHNLVLVTFDELLIVFSTKVNLLYLHYSTARRCYLPHLMNQYCLMKTFLEL